jgi:hypothetical protein
MKNIITRGNDAFYELPEEILQNIIDVFASLDVED